MIAFPRPVVFLDFGGGIIKEWVSIEDRLKFKLGKSRESLYLFLVTSIKNDQIVFYTNFFSKIMFLL